jgi:hypothetical protein
MVHAYLRIDVRQRKELQPVPELGFVLILVHQLVGSIENLLKLVLGEDMIFDCPLLVLRRAVIYLIFNRRNDAKVVASASKSPEKVRILL